MCLLYVYVIQQCSYVYSYMFSTVHPPRCGVDYLVVCFLVLSWGVYLCTFAIIFMFQNFNVWVVGSWLVVYVCCGRIDSIAIVGVW